MTHAETQSAQSGDASPTQLAPVDRILAAMPANTDVGRRPSDLAADTDMTETQVRGVLIRMRAGCLVRTFNTSGSNRVRLVWLLTPAGLRARNRVLRRRRAAGIQD